MRVRTSPRSRRATTLLWGPWYLSGALSVYTYCCDFIIVGCAKYIILDFYILNFLTIKENFSFFTNNHQCEIKTWPKFNWGQSIRWPLPSNFQWGHGPLATPHSSTNVNVTPLLRTHSGPTPGVYLSRSNNSELVI